MKTLKVVKIEDGRKPEFSNRIDKNGNPFVYIQVESPSLIKAKNEMGQEIVMKVEPQRSAFTAWPESYLLDANNKPTKQFGVDLEVGDVIPGAIETRRVKPYFIENEKGKDILEGKKGRWVDTASAIVHGNSEDKASWEVKVQQAFKSRGFELISLEEAQAHPSETRTRALDQQRVGEPSVGSPSENSTEEIQREHPELIAHDAPGSVQTHGDTKAKVAPKEGKKEIEKK